MPNNLPDTTTKSPAMEELENRFCEYAEIYRETTPEDQLPKQPQQQGGFDQQGNPVQNQQIAGGNKGAQARQTRLGRYGTKGLSQQGLDNTKEKQPNAGNK